MKANQFIITAGRASGWPQRTEAMISSKRFDISRTSKYVLQLATSVDVQLAARRFLASRTLEAILSDRNEISDAVRDEVKEAAFGYGVARFALDFQPIRGNAVKKPGFFLGPRFNAELPLTSIYYFFTTF